MTIDWVRLELDLGSAELTRFTTDVERVEAGGIRLVTLAELGNTDEQQRALYEINAVCATDIPDRGTFFTWDEFREQRLDVPSFDPDGVTVALDGTTWVGLVATSDHRDDGFVFNEMTGVVPSHRGRGIALAMKVVNMAFAERCGVATVRTVHHPSSVAMITLNRRLGYVDADRSYPVSPPSAGR